MVAWTALSRGRARRGSIGLGLQGRVLRAVQLERTREGLGLYRDLRVSFDTDTESLWQQPALLRRAVRGVFRGRRTATALPSAHLKLMVMDYQAADAHEEARAIGNLVAERVAEPLTELVVDSIPLRRPASHGAQRSAVVAVARRVEVIEYLEWIRRAGLEVASLEIAPVAIRRLVTSQIDAENDDARVALHCEGDESALLVLWGRRLLVYRDLDFSETRILDRVAKSLDVEPEVARGMLEERDAVSGSAGGESRAALRAAMIEILRPEFVALGDQVQQAFLYTASQTRGASIEHAYLLGVIRRWPSVLALLEELLPVVPESFHPFAALRPGGAGPRGDEGGGLDVAVGLALRGAPSDG